MFAVPAMIASQGAARSAGAQPRGPSRTVVTRAQMSPMARVIHQRLMPMTPNRASGRKMTAMSGGESRGTGPNPGISTGQT
jgi:hypothetical protein